MNRLGASCADVDQRKRRCIDDSVVAAARHAAAAPVGRRIPVAAIRIDPLNLARDEAAFEGFKLKLSPTTFGVFTAFPDENGRQAHLAGPIAQAPPAPSPVIDRIEMLGLKNSLKAAA